MTTASEAEFYLFHLQISFVLQLTTDFLLLPPLFFFKLQFVVADRWAPERVKGFKEERQRKGERTNRAQTAWQRFHEKLNRIAGSMQEGSREFLRRDVECRRPLLELRGRRGVQAGFYDSSNAGVFTLRIKPNMSG